MPIRFRCAYCNQLMGIARRKAGTVVRCPRCAGQVIVPNPEPAVAPGNGSRPGAAAEPARQPAAAGPALFEHGDFGKLFEPGAVAPGPPVSAPAPAFAPSPAPELDVEPIGAYAAEAGAAASGLLLTPAKLTLLCVAFVILLGLSFLLGLWVGRA